MKALGAQRIGLNGEAENAEHRAVFAPLTR